MFLILTLSHNMVAQIIPLYSDNLDFKEQIFRAKSGDIIQLHEGIYHLPSGDDVMNGLRILNHSITLECVDQKHTCIIKKNGHYDTVQIAGNNVTIKNIRIDGGNHPGTGLYHEGSSGFIHNLLIEFNGAYGILLNARKKNVISNSINNNIVRYNGSCGISMYDADSNSITNNIIHDNTAEGICIDHHSNYNAINNNRLDHNCWNNHLNRYGWGVGAIGIDASIGNTLSCNTIIHHRCSEIKLTQKETDYGMNQIKSGIHFQNNEGESSENKILFNYIRTQNNHDIYLRYQDKPMTHPMLNPKNLKGPFASHSNILYGNDATVFNSSKNWGNQFRLNQPNQRGNRVNKACRSFGFENLHPERLLD
jgi:parallel beta-helix repeat protein